MAELKYTLTTPIVDGRGEIKELTLKTPKARLFRLHGSPLTIKSERVVNPDGGEVVNAFGVFNDSACISFLADISGVDPVTLDDLSAPDYLAARGLLLQLVDKANPTAARAE